MTLGRRKRTVAGSGRALSINHLRYFSMHWRVYRQSMRSNRLRYQAYSKQCWKPNHL
ncbi:hypothetical protein FOWG_18254 [Fusarium oxysporum f. sp. lycopersici MN25]|nr:hypothetical protein FOWG_18254 [Fusarium oxysporum f. sp. lycopersici MN25]